MLQPVMSGCDLNFESLTLSVSWKESFAAVSLCTALRWGLQGMLEQGWGRMPTAPPQHQAAHPYHSSPVLIRCNPWGLGRAMRVGGVGGDTFWTPMFGPSAAHGGAFRLYLSHSLGWVSLQPHLTHLPAQLWAPISRKTHSSTFEAAHRSCWLC